MDSIKQIYKIGYGPSSSHTMGPRKAAEIFRAKHPAINRFRVTLYGSLAATGKGHLTDKAIEAAPSGPSKKTVEDIMVRTLITTTPDARIIEVLKMMMQSDIGRVPVLEQGVLVGTVSRSDIIFALYKKKV